MTSAEWIATAIAIPSVSALILILKSLVKAFVNQSKALTNQIAKDDARQTQITDAFIKHVGKQTESLGMISTTLGAMSEKISSQDTQLAAQITELTTTITRAFEKHSERTFEDHKRIWDTIATLCKQMKSATGKKGATGKKNSQVSLATEVR